MASAPAERHGVLVGVDGSDHSIAAARWAAGEAGARSLPLTLCRVVTAVPEGAEYERQRGGAQHDLDRARNHHIPAGIEVRELIVAGTASHELISLAAQAELLVVGARGRGGFTGLLLGSVSDQASTHAPSSVVVVREFLERPNAPIFVGVEESEGTRPAIDYGFRAADRDGRALVAIYAYPLPAVAPEIGYLPMSQHAHHKDRAHAFLDRYLQPWRQRHPGVTVTYQLTAQAPARAMCDASAEAHLLVVGASGNHALAGLLGSVTRKVLHHAHCPVVVAR